MLPYEEKRLRRNQRRMDAIGYALHANNLLENDAIHDLAHHLGELEDWALAFPEILDHVNSTLERLQATPKNAHDALNALCGWFTELRMHIDGAAPLIDQVCDQIRHRNPTLFSWDGNE